MALFGAPHAPPAWTEPATTKDATTANRLATCVLFISGLAFVWGCFQIRSEWVYSAKVDEVYQVLD
jgi:hypothetical protein